MLRKDDVLSGLTGRQLTDLSVLSCLQINLLRGKRMISFTISYNFPLQSQSSRHCQAHCCLAKNLRAQCASFWSSASQHAHLERKRSSQTTDFWTVKCGLLEDHQEVANPEQNGNSVQGRGQPCSSTKAATPTFSPLGPCTRHGSFTSKSTGKKWQNDRPCGGSSTSPCLRTTRIYAEPKAPLGHSRLYSFQAAKKHPELWTQ